MTKSPRASTPRRSPRSRPFAEPGPVHRWLRAALFAAAVVLPLAVLYRASAPIGPALRPMMVRLEETEPEGDGDRSGGPRQAAAAEEDEQVMLEKVLKKAAMEDNTVILTTLNEAWASPNSVLDIFIESFHIGEGTRNLLEHVVMVALDKKAYDRCTSIHPHCVTLTTEGVDFSGEKNFMTEGYLKMMWRRIDFLREVLEMGYNFIFTDTDIIWLRNPLPHFHPDGDFQIACDQFTGNESDLENMPNGGFNYVRSNNRTVEFYKFWYSAREKHPGGHDQDVLNIIKYDPFIQELGLKMIFLNTVYFGGLCEPSRDFNKVCTMHANCCIGLNRKIHDLGVMLHDWRRYMAQPPAAKKYRRHYWSVPQNCSLDKLSD